MIRIEKKIRHWKKNTVNFTENGDCNLPQQKKTKMTFVLLKKKDNRQTLETFIANTVN